MNQGLLSIDTTP